MEEMVKTCRNTKKEWLRRVEIMNRMMLRATMVEQEKRAAKLFLWMLLSVVFLIDALLVGAFKFRQDSLVALISYLSIAIVLPVVLVLFRKDRPHSVKYLLFFSYTVFNFCLDIWTYWHQQNIFGGNVAEIYFILFSPIFVSQRYCYTVISLTVIRYLLLALLFDTALPFGAIGVVLIVSIVALIVFYRFRSYVSAIHASMINQFEAVVRGIISTIELKDPYTKGHSQRVAEYASRLAGTLNVFSEDELRMIYQACLLHDVGKIHIPDSILSKPGKLTEEEYEFIKQHPKIGAEAIKDIQGIELLRDIVLYHHERWDGKGYPDGLRGTKIPLVARIAAIADSFDAMTTDRSYRNAMREEDAMDEIRKGKGSQFDPALVEYAEKVFDDWKALCQTFRNEFEKAGEAGAGKRNAPADGGGSQAQTVKSAG